MVTAFHFHTDQGNFNQKITTCKGHGQQVTSDSTLQLFMSSPQITSVPWASLLRPWQITMCERIKVRLWLIRSFKSYFLAALDAPFFLKIMECVIYTCDQTHDLLVKACLCSAQIIYQYPGRLFPFLFLQWRI